MFISHVNHIHSELGYRCLFHSSNVWFSSAQYSFEFVGWYVDDRETRDATRDYTPRRSSNKQWSYEEKKNYYTVECMVNGSTTTINFSNIYNEDIHTIFVLLYKKYFDDVKN